MAGNPTAAAESVRAAMERAGIPPGSPVLLVGHDPDLSTAVHDLTGAQVRLPKGGLAGVDRGELSVLLRPSELTAIAE